MPRYTRVYSAIHVIGSIWMPATVCGQTISVSAFDLQNMLDAANKQRITDLTRDDVRSWLDTHTGDFQTIIDFAVDFSSGEDDLRLEWEQEESEVIYNDCTFGDDE